MLQSKPCCSLLMRCLLPELQHPPLLGYGGRADFCMSAALCFQQNTGVSSSTCLSLNCLWLGFFLDVRRLRLCACCFSLSRLSWSHVIRGMQSQLTGFEHTADFSSRWADASRCPAAAAAPNPVILAQAYVTRNPEQLLHHRAALSHTCPR